MNLALKDVRHQWLRFVATALGLGLLFAIVLAMGGIYRGMVEDATVLVESQGADVWLVQRDTRGPFAERSTVPASLEDRARVAPGVEWARTFATTTIQREFRGKSLRLALVGLSWPEDRGQGLPLVSGRALERPHNEMVVDAATGLALGDRVPLADETYRVVGVVRGLVASGGDGIALLSAADVQHLAAYQSPEALRAQRATTALVPPEADLLPPAVAAAPSAVLVKARAGWTVSQVAAAMRAWTDVTVYTAAEQKDLLLQGVVEKSRQQLKLFRMLLVLVSAIIITLITFNMTTSKSREIALLKLMGAKPTVILALVLQQSVLLGVIGYAFALAVSVVAFPHFPRRVAITPVDQVGVGVLVLALCLVASLAGIIKALRVPATSILSG